MMIQDTMTRIEARLQQAEGLNDEKRKEIQVLLHLLESELTSLYKARSDDAHGIAGYIDLSTHEATRKEKRPHLFRHAIEGLSSSMIGLELAHPRLTELINSLCMFLSESGI